jgi:nitrate reductase molybdenum cofactor assembly chaperone NarJ/NarW
MLVLRALGRLLAYPDSDLKETLPEIAAAIDGSALSIAAIRALDGLIADLETGDVLDLQERYTGLFDRNRRLSLHLYEHVHGDGRERGQAMVRLQTLYGLHGLEHDPRELPDHLPLFLEFLSVLPEKAARHMLGDATTVLTALRGRLEKRESAYAAVFSALLDVSPGRIDRELLERLSKGEEGDPSFEALDAAWAEEAVTFNGQFANQAQCGGSIHQPAAR